MQDLLVMLDDLVWRHKPAHGKVVFVATTIHERIKAARLAKNWSMQRLALEVSRAESLEPPLNWQAVQQWEKATAPKRRRLETVARLLGLDVAEMIGDATIPALTVSGTMEQTMAPTADAGSLGVMVQQIGRMSQRMTPMERASLVPVFQSVLTNPDSADEAAAMAEKIAPARKGPP